MWKDVRTNKLQAYLRKNHPTAFDNKRGTEQCLRVGYKQPPKRKRLKRKELEQLARSNNVTVEQVQTFTLPRRKKSTPQTIVAVPKLTFINIADVLKKKPVANLYQKRDSDSYTTTKRKRYLVWQQRVEARFRFMLEQIVNNSAWMDNDANTIGASDFTKTFEFDATNLNKIDRLLKKDVIAVNALKKLVAKVPDVIFYNFDPNSYKYMRLMYLGFMEDSGQDIPRPSRLRNC
jgi:hypothetical protein